MYVNSRSYPKVGGGVGYGPANFKSRGLTPVKGGRINIRKLLSGRWRVWSAGKVAKNSRIFDTWAEAYHWGCVVLRCYYSFTRSEADAAIKAIRGGRVPDNWVDVKGSEAK